MVFLEEQVLLVMVEPLVVAVVVVDLEGLVGEVDEVGGLMVVSVEMEMVLVMVQE